MSQTTLAPQPANAVDPPVGSSAPPFPSRKPSWWRMVRHSLTDLLFPPQCTGCLAELTPPGTNLLLCSGCQVRLLSATARCPTCAQPTTTLPSADGCCPRCRAEKPAFQAARVIGSYQDLVRDVVLKIKHAWHEPLAMSLGRLLAQQIAAQPLPERPDLIVPVPMYWLRRLVRGSSAAHTLAESLSAELSIPLAGDLLRCCKLMAKQSSLPASERRENVRGAYAVSSAYDVRGATILVVDDVITTAATCDEAARVLRRAGVARVFAAAVARAGG